MKFGPTFGNELIAAGLGNGLAWTSEDLFGRDSLSPADQAKLDAVIAAHDPTKPASANERRIYWSTLINRLSDEQAAQLEAGVAAAGAKTRLLFTNTQWLDLDDPQGALLAGAIRSVFAGDADRILAGEF